jgi:hypothetical protein
MSVVVTIIALGLTQVGGCGSGGGGGTESIKDDDAQDPCSPRMMKGLDTTNSYMGKWSGTTDQGEKIAFTVINDCYFLGGVKLSDLLVTKIVYKINISSPICSSTAFGMIEKIGGSPIINDECKAGGIVGEDKFYLKIYFDSLGECHGTWTSYINPCDGGDGWDISGTGTFTAKKRSCTDADGDGWFAQCGPEDCNDANPKIKHNVSNYYLDGDGDGYGDANENIQACSAPLGYVSDDNDCDDSDEFVNPGEVETCHNGIDDNCDGVENEGCP